ncbi:MAG: septal ring lytic transglycosylase RlpA family protein [Saprospiraceae bacterium]
MKKLMLQKLLSTIVLVSLVWIGFAQNYTPANQPDYNNRLNNYNQNVTIESGSAVYYADYLHGQATAMGEIYSKYEFTCSHKYHPKGTLLKVTRIDNGKSVTVRVNDKGTFSGDVVISLSLAAAMELELVKTGKATVTVEVMGNSSLNPVNPNREKLVARDAIAHNYNANVYNTTSSAPAAGDRLTPRGGNGASFQWDNMQAKGAATSNEVPAAYNIGTRPNMNTSATGYGIQIGSYGVYDNADRQISNLRNAGVNNAFVKESITSSGAKLFRVMIGAFASRTEAQDYLQSLKNQYVADGIVVDLSK